MLDIRTYLEDVCYEYVGSVLKFMCGEQTPEATRLRNSLSEYPMTVRGPIDLSTPSRSVDIDRYTRIAKFLIVDYKNGKLSQEDIQSKFNIPVSRLQNTKVLFSENGISCYELVSGVIRNKIHVPSMFSSNLERVGISDGFEDFVMTVINDTVKPLELYRKLTFNYIIFGYTHGFNVGSDLMTMDLLLKEFGVLKNPLLASVDVSMGVMDSSNNIDTQSLAESMHLDRMMQVFLGSIFDLNCKTISHKLLKPEEERLRDVDDLFNFEESLSKERLEILMKITDTSDYNELVDYIMHARDDKSVELISSLFGTTNLFGDDVSVQDNSKATLDMQNKYDNLMKDYNKVKSELDEMRHKVATKNSHILDLKREISSLKSNAYSKVVSNVQTPEVVQQAITTEPDFSEKESIVVNYLNGKNVCVIGGHIAFLNNLRSRFDRFLFVEKEDYLHDDQIKYKDVIIINTICNTHGHSNKVKSRINKTQRKFIITASTYSDFIEETYNYVCHIV